MHVETAAPFFQIGERVLRTRSSLATLFKLAPTRFFAGNEIRNDSKASGRSGGFPCLELRQTVRRSPVHVFIEQLSS